MPTIPNPAEARLNNIRLSFTAAVDSFELLANSSNLPFLKPISVTARALLISVQTVRNNKNECGRLMEQLHEVLYGIMHLHIKSDTGGQLPPSTLNHIRQFSETLHKIYNFVDAQQETKKFKQFFRQAEMSALLRDCDTELQRALDIFKILGVNSLIDAQEMEEYGRRTHREVLELIAALSDEISSKGSSEHIVFSGDSGDNHSSNSLSLLPSEPKIFHGRETEVTALLKMFTPGTPRVSILGTGGIGKTSLAKAILHHQEILTRYKEHRFFVTCDSVSTKTELAAHIGAHLGLKSGRDSTQQVIHHFAQGPPCLLILDNLETVWEATEARRDIEDLLSLLTDVEHLALIITMRGAERPAKVQWTRPFLPPLQPLTQEAARLTFIDIADDIYDLNSIDQVLSLTGNMPLAIDLISHLVAEDGCANVLCRWNEDKTSLISEGYDRRSNLDLSIALSLSSPRMASIPQAQDLLSLLSILPDGLSDVELRQAKIPIANIFSCKVALLRTSLAYSDDTGRLKVLIPIREYLQKFHPPPSSHIEPLLDHLQELLDIQKESFRTGASAGIMRRITVNHGNIESILTRGLRPDNPDLVKTIQCTLTFVYFCRVASRLGHHLMDQIPDLLSPLNDHELEIYVVNEIFIAWAQHPVHNPKILVDRALKHLEHVNQPLQCMFYMNVGSFYWKHSNDLSTALTFLKKAKSLSSGNPRLQSRVLWELAWIDVFLGNYSAAQINAQESQRLAKSSARLYDEALALQVQIVCWHTFGQYNRAVHLCQTARNLLGLCDMSYGQLDYAILTSQVEIHEVKSEYVQACNILAEIQNRISSESAPHRHAFTLLFLSKIGVTIGTEKEVVQRQTEAASTTFNLFGNRRLVTWCDAVQADLNLREGNIFLARKKFQECLKSSWGIDATLTNYCLETLGEGCRWGTLIMDSWTTIFFVQALKTKENISIHKALQFLADVFLCLDDEDTATSLLTVALEGFTHMDVHHSKGECMLRLGQISRKQGDLSRAHELWEAARPLFERSSQPKQIVQINERISSITQLIAEAQHQESGHLSELHPPPGPLDTPLASPDDEVDIALHDIKGLAVV